MLEQPNQVEKYGVLVWQNPTIEALRREECLCLHCARIDRDCGGEGCTIAGDLFAICKRENVAFPVSRCPKWLPCK